MFGLFGEKERSSPQLDSQDNIIKAIKKLGFDKVGGDIRKEAFDGNIECQIFLSLAYLQINDAENAEIYTKLAAESGDPMSQENLALIYMKKLDADAEYLSEQDIMLIKSAKYWYGKAVAQGSPSAVAALKNLEVFPD